MTTHQEKIAVVMLNLGGPTGMETIRPFLYNFFMDKNIVRAPLPVRWLLAQWISITRSRGAAKESYSHFNGVSPLLENTRAQATALEQSLADEYPHAKVFIAMRYWHPFADETVKAVKDFAPDKIILLPLYPQFSTTTTLSAFENWRQAAARGGLDVPTHSVCCYPEDAGFIAASADLIGKAVEGVDKPYRLLFSAHGLPEQIILAGDPYADQCRNTAEAIVNKLNLSVLYWKLCYQSRIGRLKWIGPSIDETLQAAARDGVGVVIYPSAFVSEHVETLVELDIEYKERAEKLGIPFYIRVPTVSTHPWFIAGLKNLVAAAVHGDVCDKTCPQKCSVCYEGAKEAS